MYRLHQSWGIFKIWDGNAWSRDALSREQKSPACIFVVIQSNCGQEKVSPGSTIVCVKESEKGPWQI